VDAKVYDFVSHLVLEGIFIYSEDRAEEKIQLTIYGSNSDHSDFELTLADCQVRDGNGSLKYRKVRGKEVPVYDVFLRVSDILNVKGEQEPGGVVYGLNNEQLPIC